MIQYLRAVMRVVLAGPLLVWTEFWGARPWGKQK